MLVTCDIAVLPFVYTKALFANYDSLAQIVMSLSVEHELPSLIVAPEAHIPGGNDILPNLRNLPTLHTIPPTPAVPSIDAINSLQDIEYASSHLQCESGS